MTALAGFVDIQVNGYDGIDFSEKGLTIEGVKHATEKLVKSGTWAYCPTIITNDIELICENSATIVKALSVKPFDTHFLGLHIEGPFISPEDGFRGAHPLAHVKKPDIKIFQKIQASASDRVVMMTYAPEIEGAAQFADQMKNEKAKLSIGHSNAGILDVQNAVKAGVGLATHLGNGAKNILPRHPNILQSLLIADEILAGIITDGHHLGETFIRLCLKAKGIKGLYVTSDSTSLAGYPAGRYHTLGQEVIVSSTGRVGSAQGDFLVGSASNAMMCMNHLASLIKELTENDLLQLGVYNSLRAIGKQFPKDSGLVSQKLIFDNNTRQFSIL